MRWRSTPFLPILAAAVAVFLLGPIAMASAQFRQAAPPQPPPPQQGGFFNFLFGPPRFLPPPPQPVRPRATNPSGTPQVGAKAPVAKDAQARKILVVGDFVGQVVAAGLDRAFAEEAKIRVVDRTNPNSGLSRQDYYDWARTLPGILAAERPDIIVVMLGANDRQQLTGSSGAPWGSPEWQIAYGDRVTALATALAAYSAPFFWMGTVPMRSTPEPDMAFLNDLFRPRVTMAGGHFVDVWDGFADDNGKLVMSGPDVDGQIRPLRTPNGINFTDAGQAKLAFYVAREIRRTTGIGAGATDLVAAVSQGSRIEIGPDGRRRVVGPVISLNDPPPGAAAALAGDPKAPTAPGAASVPLLAAPRDPASPQALLIRAGGLPTVPGRADDFSRPPAPASAAPNPAPAPTAAR